MSLDLSKSEKHTKIKDAKTGLTIIIAAGDAEIPYTSSAGNGVTKVRAADYFIEVPPDKLAEFGKKLGGDKELPADGIIYASRDVPDTLGYNLNAVFDGLKNLGYGLSETTKQQAQAFMEQYFEFSGRSGRRH